MDDKVIVAGPDTTAFTAAESTDPIQGLRFRPGILPRLLGVPASELRNTRVDLRDLRRFNRGGSLEELTEMLASRTPAGESAPWSLPLLHRITHSLAHGATVADTARDTGWSTRTLQRQCASVYGYGPAMLRRILRFRRAMDFMNTGMTAAQVAVRAGYADQPHLHREVRALAGVGITQLRQPPSAANRSTEVRSGSSTVA